MTKRVPFTKELECETVRLAETSGRTRREVAEDLGIGLSPLTQWISRNRDAAIDDPELVAANEDMPSMTAILGRLHRPDSASPRPRCNFSRTCICCSPE